MCASQSGQERVGWALQQEKRDEDHNGSSRMEIPPAIGLVSAVEQEGPYPPPAGYNRSNEDQNVDEKPQ